MDDEIVIPEAIAHSRIWRDATELAERFPSIELAVIEIILIEARRNVDLLRLEREEERVAATERITVAVLEANEAERQERGSDASA